MGKVGRLADPFEIPAHLIPPGMIFQWVAKKAPDGRIESQYQRMIEAGWGEVPYARMKDFYRGRYRGEGDEILVGGQVLMERAKEMSVVARDKEIDKSFKQAGQGRNTAVELMQHVKLSAEELSDAIDRKMSAPEYIKMKVTMIANGMDNSMIRGWNGSLMFIKPPVRRVPRKRWLGWLLDLISKETTEYSDD